MKTEENKLQINAGSTNHFKDRINLTKRLSTSKVLYKYYLLLINGLKKHLNCTWMYKEKENC